MTTNRQSLITLLKTIQHEVLPLTDSGVHVYLDVDINGELCIEIMLTKYQIVTGIQLDDTDDLENPQTVIDFSVNWFKEQLPRIQKAIAEQKVKATGACAVSSNVPDERPKPLGSDSYLGTVKK